MTADLLPDPAPKPPEGEPVRPPHHDRFGFQPVLWSALVKQADAYMDWQAAEIARLTDELGTLARYVARTANTATADNAERITERLLGKKVAHGWREQTVADRERLEAEIARLRAGRDRYAEALANAVAGYIFSHLAPGREDGPKLARLALDELTPLVKDLVDTIQEEDNP